MYFSKHRATLTYIVMLRLLLSPDALKKIDLLLYMPACFSNDESHQASSNIVALCVSGLQIAKPKITLSIYSLKET